MRSRLRRAALAGATLVAFSAQMAIGEGTIKLGVIAPTSGGAAFVGLAVIDGVKLAVEEINAAGGIDGKMLEYVVRDEESRPDVSVAAAKELISAEHIDALIGPATSGAALAVSELTQTEKIVNMSPTSSAGSLTNGRPHDFVFQFAPTSETDGKRVAAILEKLNSKQVCLAGYDYAATDDLFRDTRADLPASVTITNEYRVKLGNTEYSTLISQLMADPCDTIVGHIWGGGFVALAKQAEPFGLFKTKKMIASGNNGDYATLAALKGQFPEGIWTNAHDLWYYDELPALNAYHEALAKLQGHQETTMFSINGYVATKMLAAGIEKAGTTDGVTLAKALEGLTIDSPLGPLTVDPETHRVNIPVFWGPITTVAGSDVKHMSPAELMR